MRRSGATRAASCRINAPGIVAAISLPHPRRFSPAPRPEPPLLQFVVLSILLHVLIVLLFGNPERGGGGPIGAWRDVPFAVTLRALLTERESPFKPSHGADEGSSGSTLARRPSPAASGAATPTRPVRPQLEAPPVTTEPTPPPTPPEPAVESPAREEAPAPGTLPRLDLGAPEVVDKAVVPNAEIRPQEPPTATTPRVDLEAPSTVPPEPRPVPARRELPPVTPPVARPVPPTAEPLAIPKPEAPAPSEAPAEALPQIERETAPKVGPVAPPAAEPPVETPPRIEPEVAPKVEAIEKPPTAEPAAKREAPAETPPRVEPEAVPKVERPIVAPPPLAPRESPATVAPPRESAPASTIERATTPAAPQVAPRERPAEAPAPTTREAPPKTEAESPRAAQPPALREAPAAAPLPRLRYGVPSDVDDIFAPRKPGDAPAASAPAPVDIDAARIVAREPSRITYGRTGIIPLNLVPPPPEPESKLGRAIQKAAQPDCRDAYAAMGLLAIPFLLKDTVTDTGCRW